ncbi:ComEA family DNA-binding protein [Paenibacillus eucommiae]|uniref:Competence protein ComEA n=1 Tax=Paenibacillus eucommiae TaxID=1355755 RepID=A0ABS4IZB5_9BACL|nr:ComEA family DNA-binding protein [Paenibacillus eucommiae]MBP1992893.1 competence protein ComEA [Paenibacillus eucommiae]
MNLITKKGVPFLLAAISVLLIFVLVRQFGQGGYESAMGFSPVNEQMSQLIDQTSKNSVQNKASNANANPNPNPNPKSELKLVVPAENKSSAPPDEFTAGTPAAKASAQPNTAAPQSTASGMNSTNKEDSANKKEEDRLDLNAATLEQLDDLPGIGESKAKAILAYRLQQGSFKNVEQLIEVKGIGPKMLAKLIPYVYVENQ